MPSSAASRRTRRASSFHWPPPPKRPSTASRQQSTSSPSQTGASQAPDDPGSVVAGVAYFHLAPLRDHPRNLLHAEVAGRADLPRRTRQPRPTPRTPVEYIARHGTPPVATHHFHHHHSLYDGDCHQSIDFDGDD